MKLPNLTKTLLALAISALPLLSPSPAMAATLSLSPATGTFNKGCTFTLKVNLDTAGAKTDGTDAILLFNPAQITPSQFAVQNGTIYPDYSNVVDPASGKITISGISSVSQAFSGSGTLATVSLQVSTASTPGPFTVKFDFDPSNKQKTTDSNVVERGTVAELLASVTDGNYTIGTGSGCNGADNSGSSKGGLGGPDASGSGQTVQPVYRLPTSGSFDNTLILAAAGSFFLILGIIGLVIL